LLRKFWESISEKYYKIFAFEACDCSIRDFFLILNFVWFVVWYVKHLTFFMEIVFYIVIFEYKKNIFCKKWILWVYDFRMSADWSSISGNYKGGTK